MAEDYSGSMAIARASIVQLRLQGLTLAALVERGVLLPKEAAGLVREAATFLADGMNSPTIQKLYEEAYESTAKDLEGSRPGSPLPAKPRRDRRLA